jgi:hypothetical protein
MGRHSRRHGFTLDQGDAVIVPGFPLQPFLPGGFDNGNFRQFGRVCGRSQPRLPHVTRPAERPQKILSRPKLASARLAVHSDNRMDSDIPLNDQPIREVKHMILCRKRTTCGPILCRFTASY